jgi:protein-tyrosine phosphatase
MSHFVDLHCHILPDTDDGPPDVEQAATLVHQLTAIGFSDFYPTPHQKAGYFSPTAEETAGAAALLRQALDGAGFDGVIHPPAAENMWDELFLVRIDGGYPTYPGGKAFLLELPVDSTPPGLEERLFQLRVGGQLPVLAHVERYRELTQRGLQRLGVLGQRAALLVNLSAIGGGGGWGMRRLARKLVRGRWVHAASTDAHAIDDIAPCVAGIRWIQEHLGEEVLRRLLVDHPQRILAGELPEW